MYEDELSFTSSRELRRINNLTSLRDVKIPINTYIPKPKIYENIITVDLINNKYYDNDKFKLINYTYKSGVYVLLLDNGKIYVGKSNNIRRRINCHIKKCGAKFTKLSNVKYILNPITPPINNLDEWEKLETLMQMKINGVNNVRGYCYCHCKEYNESLVNSITKRINNTFG